MSISSYAVVDPRRRLPWPNNRPDPKTGFAGQGGAIRVHR